MVRRQVSIGASIGITFSHQGYSQPEAAIRDADVAMYQAKKNEPKNRLKIGCDRSSTRSSSRLLSLSSDGSEASDKADKAAKAAKAAKAPILIQPESSVTEQHFVVFNVDAQTQSKSEQALKNELHQAVVQDQFQLYYQPIFDLTLGSSDPRPAQPITGFEVLLRWQHPTRGCLRAENFIELAESIGIVRQLGKKNNSHRLQANQTMAIAPPLSKFIPSHQPVSLTADEPRTALTMGGRTSPASATAFGLSARNYRKLAAQQ